MHRWLKMLVDEVAVDRDEVAADEDEIAAALRCGEMRCASYLHACESAATAASIDSSAAR